VEEERLGQLVHQARVDGLPYARGEESGARSGQVADRVGPPADPDEARAAGRQGPHRELREARRVEDRDVARGAVCQA
ncbi:hypothetical protein THAOC_24054, partial [Thalassiosira oceanica]